MQPDRSHSMNSLILLAAKRFIVYSFWISGNPAACWEITDFRRHWRVMLRFYFHLLMFCSWWHRECLKEECDGTLKTAQWCCHTQKSSTAIVTNACENPLWLQMRVWITSAGACVDQCWLQVRAWITMAAGACVYHVNRRRVLSSPNSVKSAFEWPSFNDYAKV